MNLGEVQGLKYVFCQVSRCL